MENNPTDHCTCGAAVAPERREAVAGMSMAPDSDEPVASAPGDERGPTAPTPRGGCSVGATDAGPGQRPVGVALAALLAGIALASTRHRRRA